MTACRANVKNSSSKSTKLLNNTLIACYDQIKCVLVWSEEELCDISILTVEKHQITLFAKPVK